METLEITVTDLALTEIAKATYSAPIFGHDYSGRGKGRQIYKPFPYQDRYWVCNSIHYGIPDRQPDDPPDKVRFSMVVHCYEAVPLGEYTGAVAEDKPFKYHYIPMTDPDGVVWILTENKLAVEGGDIFEDRKNIWSPSKRKKAPVKEEQPEEKPKPGPTQLDFFDGPQHNWKKE